jgi:hypothetical protein
LLPAAGGHRSDAARNPGRCAGRPAFEAGTGAPITAAAQQATSVTEIRWSSDDALPCPVCISSNFLDSNGDQQFLTGVSVVFGNVVLADQGLSLSGTALPPVPAPSLFRAPSGSDRCNPAPAVAFVVRYRPQVPESPVTQAVPLPLAGSPVTANAVSLLSNGFVSLTDANGYTCLMVAADAPRSWPQYFGVLAAANASDPANFDLSVVFNPPRGPAGMTGPIVLKRFTDLTLMPGTANYAATELNSLSRFVRVPSAYTPPASNPSAFPAAPTMLANSGTVELRDSGNSPYLTLQPVNPLSLPPLFGVLAQGCR